MRLENEIKEIIRDDPHLAREVHWRGKGYRKELAARLEEEYDTDASPGEISNAVNNIPNHILVENGEYDADTMESPIREEFKY